LLHSRYPEPGSYSGWQNLYWKIQNATFTAKDELSFLKDWDLSSMIDDQPHMPLYLTSTGALEAFELGTELRKRYKLTPGGGNLTIWYVCDP
jgi:acid phosphatase